MAHNVFACRSTHPELGNAGDQSHSHLHVSCRSNRNLISLRIRHELVALALAVALDSRLQRSAPFDLLQATFMHSLLPVHSCIVFRIS